MTTRPWASSPKRSADTIPKDAKNRRLYAQYLIETGKATAAVDLLARLAERLPKNHPELAEATGLLGRAYKQIFFDAGDKTSPGAREALKQAIVAYRGPYEQDPRTNTWHGVNLLALLTRARRLGLRIAPDLKPQEIARALLTDLDATPPEKRNEWHLPTLAEASLGLTGLGYRRAQHPRLRGGRERQGVPDRQHAASVHASVGHRGNG